jgi:hypothetical protein
LQARKEELIFGVKISENHEAKFIGVKILNEKDYRKRTIQKVASSSKICNGTSFCACLLPWLLCALVQRREKRR